MKNPIFNIALKTILGILIITTLSCQNEHIEPIESENIEINPQLRSRFCNIEFEDFQVDWADDCQSANVTITVCCPCTVISANQDKKEGCFGEIEVIAEVGPFNFVSLTEGNLPIVISAGGCMDLSFDVETVGGAKIYLSQLFFNEESLDFDYNQNNGSCN